MYYLIYKIINTINGKVYIGKHQTKDKFDGYFGSGIYLNRAIKKYGKQCFTYQILLQCQSRQEMNDKEREIVNESFLRKSNNYNLNIGGHGGWHYVNSTGKNIHHTSTPCSEQKKKKLSQSNKGQIRSEQIIRIVAQKNRGRKATQQHKDKISKS